jgi:tetratricopeptide (TPR) repeat protein
MQAHDHQNEELNQLRQSIEIMQGRIDELQTSINVKRPWYTKLSTITSALALLFSFGTTYVSYKRVEAQDIQNSRTELRGVLQRLSTLPRDDYEIKKKYANDPASSVFLSSLFNQENSFLAQQAAEIADRIPDYITASEYYAIQTGLINSAKQDQAVKYLEKAIEKARNPNDELAALRTKASLFFLNGHAAEGREIFARALAVFEKYPGFNDSYQKSVHVQTELIWHTAELRAGFHQNARARLDEAKKIALAVDSGPFREQLLKQVTQVDAGLQPTTSAPQFPTAQVAPRN